jgi:hypothetical protein
VLGEMRLRRKWERWARVQDFVWFVMVLGMLALSGWALIRMDSRADQLHELLLTPVPVVIVTPRP